MMSKCHDALRTAGQGAAQEGESDYKERSERQGGVAPRLKSVPTNAVIACRKDVKMEPKPEKPAKAPKALQTLQFERFRK